jgi:hypothetical protein
VLNNRYFDRGKILITKPPLFCFRPCERALVELEDVLDKLEFLVPEEAVGIEFERVEALLCESFPWREVGRMGCERRQRKEGVSGYAADGAELFRECCCDGSNFVVDFFVFEYEG